MLPFNPESANTPNNAVVFSILTPVALEVGATSFKDSVKPSKFNAEDAVLKERTSTTLCVSVVSNPKALTVLPANIAALDKSTSNDDAKSKIAGVEFSISLTEKPNFASSVCNPTT